jgi:hypothetical protein
VAQASRKGNQRRERRPPLQVSAAAANGLEGFAMDLGSRLDVLLTLAEEIGIDVRTEPMGGDGGGLCVLKGRRVLFVDISADLATRYEHTLAGMANLKELQDRFIVPEVRRDLEHQRDQTDGRQP